MGYGRGIVTSSDSKDFLTSGSSAPSQRRWWPAVAALAALTVVWVLLHQETPPSTPHADRTVATPSPGPTAAPLHAVGIRSDGRGVSRTTSGRAAFGVLVSNPNDQPVFLLRMGEAINGMSLYSSAPSPQQIPPHGEATIVVTFERYPRLACRGEGTQLFVAAAASSSNQAAVLTWRLPLRIDGLPWDAALAAVLCRR